jgi:DNA segregation ATPase FtsK/SpoIIIE-like protein
MEFREVLKNIDSKDSVILGKKDDRLLGIDINDYPSIIITGATGTGKSVLVDQIICELISTHTSLEMGLVLVDTTGVELNKYAESRYSYYASMGNDMRELVCITKVLREINRRKELFAEQGVDDIVDYNEVAPSKLPLVVLAIDDNQSLIADEDARRMIRNIIKEIPGLGIFFILAENDVSNAFFERNDNLKSAVLVSYDLANEFQSKYVNIKDSNNLETGKFLVRIEGQIDEYEDFKFDDNIIDEILEKK